MRFFRAIAASLLVVLPVQAVDLPDLGESSRTALSEIQEDQLGRVIMRQIRAHRDYVDDAELTDYLNNLGDRLAASSTDPSRRFEFFAVKDPTINAFALPGGYIGVHTGLIAAARSESELAGVLAHEIAHVTQAHIARMVDAQKSSGLVSLAALAVAILAARSNPEVSRAAITLSQAMTVQSQLDFTRDNEREADRVGLQALLGAGFEPAGMASFFERLQAQGRLYENNAPAYLRTHPLTYQRIADMQNRVASLPYRQHEDSLEFRLLRARVWADEGTAADAMKRFGARVEADPGDPAGWYGLARAAWRDNRPDEARQAVRRLDALRASSPLVDILAAEADQKGGRPADAVNRLASALARHSDNRPLSYAYARALLNAQRADQALAFLEGQLRTWPEDIALFMLKAQAHEALGQLLDAHLAQAEAYSRQGATGAAIEQLQFAQSTRDRDFYKRSIVEARLAELRARQRLEDKPR
ncbi:MAG: M48 family metalloprotease [Thiobacillaceae bacterium]|jgi:predicted Zn-dependent protease|nr:M48 family metalloprotease [Thiobacillaceae bacterium]